MEFRDITLPQELGAVKVPAIGRRTSMQFYKHAIDHAPTQTWAEFGVATGRSANWFLKLLKKDGKLHLFDSFEGLPEDWDLNVDGSQVHRKGTFSRNGVAPHIDDDRAVIHQGWFSETLPVEFEEQLGFVHLDADLYSSTRDALAGIKDFIGPGTVLVFDELIQWGGAVRNCNTNWREHEYKALKESGIQMEWLATDGACAVAGVVV